MAIQIPIIKIETERGEVLDFSTTTRYAAMLTGTGPPSATINRSKVSVTDGTRYNSGSVGERPLLLTVYILRDVARARLNLYRFLATNTRVKVHYQADGLEVYIEGYVETAEINPWETNQNMQVSIICPDPYWKDEAETYTDASAVQALFEFPFSIDSEGVELSAVDRVASTVVENNGTADTGVTFELTATTNATNPRIHNLSTGEYIALDVGLRAGDKLVVTTSTDNKSVTHIRGGVRSNYINTVRPGSKWLRLAVGANEYSYTTDTGECNLAIYHTNRYIGV